jgi:hypothetical protein
MRKFLFPSAMLIAIALTSFTSSNFNGTVKKHASGFSTASAGFTEVVPFSADIDIPCTGETVTVSGNLLIVSTFQINGSRVSAKSLFSPMGVSGVSTSGESYQATGNTQFTFTGSLVNGQFSSIFVNNFRIIGQGPGNNFLVHETGVITFNANGTVSAVIDNFSIECK